MKRKYTPLQIFLIVKLIIDIIGSIVVGIIALHAKSWFAAIVAFTFLESILIDAVFLMKEK